MSEQKAHVERCEVAKRSARAPKPKLTPKQEQFCREYLIDLNVTAAARRAGYSFRTANQIGAENLAKPGIQAQIDKLMAERAEMARA